MENLDIIILTIVVSVLFLWFLIGTFKEFSKIDEEPFKGGKEGGPRARMIELLGELFSEGKIELKDKQALINIIEKSKADIETVDQSG